MFRKSIDKKQIQREIDINNAIRYSSGSRGGSRQDAEAAVLKFRHRSALLRARSSS